MRVAVVTRAHLRGKPLDRDCYKANRTTHEYGPEDDRVFCFGLIDMSTEELLGKCRECGANVVYAEPLKKESIEQQNCIERFKE